MPTIRDDAIVLGRVDYSETSQVLVLFTREHGKVRAIAKGVKRGAKARFAAGIDLLEIGHVMLSSRHERPETLATLTEWKQAHALGGLRETLFRLDAALYAAELTAQLTEDWDPHVDLFHQLVVLMQDLCGADEPLGPITRFQLSLLEAIGAMPRFDACVWCGREQDITHFSSLEGGLVCRHCEPHQVEKRELSPLTVVEIQRMLKLDSPLVAARTLEASETTRRDVRSARDLFATLNYHLTHLMGRPPKLAVRLLSPARR